MHNYSDFQQEAMGGNSQGCQKTLVHALLHAQASLHRRSGVDLQQLVAIIEELPGPRQIALYLRQDHHFYRVRHTPTEENGDIQREPVPDTLFARLQPYQYHSGQAYILPIAAVQDRVPELLPSLAAGHTTTTQKIVLIPLLAQTSPPGFLALGDMDYENYEAIDLFTLFAQQLAMYLERTQLHRDLQHVHAELLALTAVRRSVLAPEALQDVQTVYRTIYAQLKTLMPIDFFAIERYDQQEEKIIQDFKVESDEVLTLPEDRTLPSPFLDFIWNANPASFMFTSLEEWKQLYEHSAVSEMLNYEHKNMPLPSGNVPLSGISAVIKYAGEPVGILTTLTYQEHSYTQRHLRMLTSICDQVAIAIRNASMYSELREALTVAQESEQLKDQFLMTASHELRTPLTAVQGYLELLKTFNETLSEETKHQFLNNAHRACEELVLLLGNIMDASRLDQDKVEMTLRPVRLIEPVRTIIEIMEPTIIRESRSVAIQLPDELQVIADDLRLRQVLLNLVGNALKYSLPPQGIALYAEALTHEQLAQRCSAAQEAAHEQYVMIAIHDWGPGIAPEDQPRLFTKFMRLNGAINSTQRGAGLGLYLCHQLTEAMHGYIWMESSGVAGEGTTFFVALPRAG